MKFLNLKAFSYIGTALFSFFTGAFVTRSLMLIGILSLLYIPVKSGSGYLDELSRLMEKRTDNQQTLDLIDRADKKDITVKEIDSDTLIALEKEKTKRIEVESKLKDQTEELTKLQQENATQKTDIGVLESQKQELAKQKSALEKQKQSLLKKYNRLYSQTKDVPKIPKNIRDKIQGYKNFEGFQEIPKSVVCYGSVCMIYLDRPICANPDSKLPGADTTYNSKCSHGRAFNSISCMATTPAIVDSPKVNIYLKPVRHEGELMSVCEPAV